MDVSKVRELKPLDTKTRAFATIIPGDESTYVFTDEKAYMDDYENSYFAFTWKKGGYDCMRHYEIIAAGAVPYFVGLEDVPVEVMRDFPRADVLAAMALPGVSRGAIDFSVFPKAEYGRLRDRIRAVFMHALTNTAVAGYVLRTVAARRGASRPPISRVLFVSSEVRPDYMRCTLLTGLKRVLGDHAVLDVVKIAHIYTSFAEADACRLYGHGFNYTRILNDVTLDRSSDAVRSDIASRVFDVIIFGSLHRGLPLLDAVTAAYTPADIAFVCGEDEHVCALRPVQGAAYFIREGHNAVECQARHD